MDKKESIDFAKVRFQRESKDITLKVELIRNIEQSRKEGGRILSPFKPQNEKDFEEKWYAGAWPCSDSKCAKASEEHNHFYRLKILLLAKTEKDLEEKYTKRRPKHPLLKSSDETLDSDSNSNDTNDSNSDDSVDEGFNKLLAARKRKKSILDEYKMQRRTHQDSDSESELDSREEICKTTERQIKKQKLQENIVNEAEQSTNSTFACQSSYKNQEKTNIQKEKKKINNKTKDKENRNSTQPTKYAFNAKRKQSFNTTDKLDVFGIPAAKKVESDKIRELRKASSFARYTSYKKKRNKIPDTTYEFNVHARMYEVFEDDIYLGLDVYCNATQWKTELMGTDPEKFLRNAADIVWTGIKLANRALCLKGAKEINPFSPRKTLEEDRLQLLYKLYEDYLSTHQYNEYDKIQKLLEVRNVLRQKIQDNRPMLLEYIKEKRLEENEE